MRHGGNHNLQNLSHYNFTIMEKMRYAKPVTEIEVQTYTETPLLVDSFETTVNPGTGNYREGIPSTGGSIGNPSFVSGGNSNYLWEEEESDY